MVLYLIVRREIRERLRTNSFRIFTAGLFLVVLGAIVAIDKAPDLFDQGTLTLGVSSSTPPPLRDALQAAAASEDAEFELTDYGDLQEARRRLDDGKLDAFLFDRQLTYKSSEDSTLTAIVNRGIYSYDIEQRLDGLGLSPAQQEDLLNPQQVSVGMLDAGRGNQGERQLVGFIAALSLYLTLAIYGTWILTGIVEEKSTRVVEVLLGLVRPDELLAGKTIGILAVAVGQLVVALAAAAIGLLVLGTISLPSVAADVVFAAVPLYILGLLLYSLIYAAIGATVSRQADAQAAATPVTILLMVPYFFSAVFIPQSPDSLVASIMSIFPLTSPLVMPARVASGNPATIELVACYVLLVPAILLTTVVGGRIYSGGILSARKQGWARMLDLVLRPTKAA